MQETPERFNSTLAPGAQLYPAENLSGFRWHTGATLRPLASDEPCKVMFRDIGPAALAMFLRGELKRLAGPLAPLVYMRSADYVEPYTDYERTGRLVLLRPLSLQPWHAGTPHVYVARARPGVDAASVGFVPGDLPLAEAAQLAQEAADVSGWREALGNRAYDEAVAESLLALDRLAAELARTEERAAPLRRRLQSADRAVRQQAQDEMGRVGLTESDLCTAWHHLPRERRGWILEALAELTRGNARKSV
jgi:hypothetical protein